MFYPGQPRPVFFVANRGHHADIGGITPGRLATCVPFKCACFYWFTNPTLQFAVGSMPPHSKLLAEEGATFRSFKLVQNGAFDEKGNFSRLISDLTDYIANQFVYHSNLETSR